MSAQLLDEQVRRAGPEGPRRPGDETGGWRPTMTMAQRHNVKVMGSGPRTMVFAHGFGCDQNMWRFVAPAFADRFRVVLFDHVGAGGSDLSAYDPERYGTLQGYADDVVALCREL